MFEALSTVPDVHDILAEMGIPLLKYKQKIGSHIPVPGYIQQIVENSATTDATR